MRVSIAFALLTLLPVTACSRDDSVQYPGADAGYSSDRLTPVPIRDAGFRACTEAAQLVYVLSEENDLYAFQPNLRRFTRIGPLRCPTTFRPNSMAIDRDAIAWVNYIDPASSTGVIYRVNTADATCTAARAIDLPQDFRQLGMGFSTAGVDSADETLFVAGTGSSTREGPGLARIDAAGALARIGGFSGALRGRNAELTGTGDGRLYGFFTTTPVQVAQIDKSTGAITSTRMLPTVETPDDWAFSFWGGAFYLYTSPSQSSHPERTSNVTLYRPSDDTVDPAYMVNVGFRIVGAGVSTCAPIAPPP